MATFGSVKKPGTAMPYGSVAPSTHSVVGPTGPMENNLNVDPNTGAWSRTGAQRGTDAGQALRALQEASGLNLLGSSTSSGAGRLGSRTDWERCSSQGLAEREDGNHGQQDHAH